MATPLRLESCQVVRLSRLPGSNQSYTELHFLVEFNKPLQALQDTEGRETESYTFECNLVLEPANLLTC